MFGSLSQAGTKALGGHRFLLINVLPGALLTLIIVGAYRTNLYSTGDIDFSNAVPRGWDVAGLAFAMILLGVMAQPFQIGIVQMLEGYGWRRWLPSVLSEAAYERHRRRLQAATHFVRYAHVDELTTRTLADAVREHRAELRLKRAHETMQRRRSEYPKNQESLMPTRLGNVLRALEDDAGRPYGLDSMTVYPRMYPYLSSKLHVAIKQQLDLIDTTSALCVSFGAAAVATMPVLLIRLDAWGALPLIFAGLAWLSYQGAVLAAKDHGVLFASAFDLHRFDMIESLRYPLPVTLSEEVAFNRQLSDYLQDREPHDQLDEVMLEHLSQYMHPPRASAHPPSQPAEAGAAPPDGAS